MLKEFWLLKKQDEINLYRWNGKNNKNFWDILWPYLVEKISEKKPNRVNKYCLKEYFLTIWSIFSNANKNSIIWWSGIIWEKEKIKKPKKIYAVRWPKTRERLISLWYDCPKIYGDPWLLISKFYKPKIRKKYELWIIPHYVDYKKICEKWLPDNVKIINLLDPIEKVIDDIYSCKRTISSSLHGIIVSHSYNIPSMWVEFSKKLAGDGVKFEDYFLSVGIKPYKWYDYNIIPEIKEIIDFLDINHNDVIKINLDILLKVCPFKIKK